MTKLSSHKVEDEHFAVLSKKDIQVFNCMDASLVASSSHSLKLKKGEVILSHCQIDAAYTGHFCFLVWTNSLISGKPEILSFGKE